MKVSALPGLAKPKTISKHGLINPLGSYSVNSPIRDSPAAFPDCYSVTILKWDLLHTTELTPVTRLEAHDFHYSNPLRIRIKEHTPSRK
jgi:hypothetical protein